MDEITKLELELEKLSSNFYNSIHAIQRYAPLVSLENEENMENSKENKDRIEIEKIDNYQETKENYNNLIQSKTDEINNCFNTILGIVNELKNKEEYTKSEEELKRSLKNLREMNEIKIKNVNEKIKHTEEIVNNIKKENEINMHILRYTTNLSLDFNNN